MAPGANHRLADEANQGTAGGYYYAKALEAQRFMDGDVLQLMRRCTMSCPTNSPISRRQSGAAGLPPA